MSNANLDLVPGFEPHRSTLNLDFTIPDVEMDAGTGLSSWPYFANGVRVGRIDEDEQYYVAVRESADGTEQWRGPGRSFRAQAISDLEYEVEDAMTAGHLDLPGTDGAQG